MNCTGKALGGRDRESCERSGTRDVPPRSRNEQHEGRTSRGDAPIGRERLRTDRAADRPLENGRGMPRCHASIFGVGEKKS